ncbi:hypothetical protein HL666_28690 [Bradyrhizobium sp. 83002]|uniref:hypothetical protein n=1 Tax=Bradyrhizobium aeschynomenes TaxID=2734909 RepID=UPI001551707C|nr:hypothetical protein [Bradyrhizobium aeschynomenes]NPU14757.1 hypothetical protein [Bradyrhizobium aeschynomenes]
MLRWPLGLTAAMGLILSAAAEGQAVDCGAAPTVKCLASTVFRLAKTLPEDSFVRRQVTFAEQELAPGDLKVALSHIHSDAPDSPPWEDIDWIAQAGRFDRAIELARQRASAVERLGGLAEVASQLLDKEQTARAAKLVDEVERALPSLKAEESDEYASVIPQKVGRLRARLGQIDRATRLFKGGGLGSVSELLDIAEKYPVAVSLRELAWQEAESANEPYAWELMLKDASTRGPSDVSDAVRRIGDRLYGKLNADSANTAAELVRLLLSAGLRERADKLIDPWPQWVNGRKSQEQCNTLMALLPVLVDLARDQDVEKATHAVEDPRERTQCMSIAANSYFRIGRTDRAMRFDREALFVAQNAPAFEARDRVERDSILHNLALMRADHGDIEGALNVVAKISDEAKMRDVTAWVVTRAILGGHGPVAGPAIAAVQQQARTTQDARLWLEAASDWSQIDNETEARSALAEAMKLIKQGQPSLNPNDISLAAELTWRIEGKEDPRAMLAIVDQLGINDPNAIDRLVETMRSISPAAAVQLASRQTEVERQIDELAAIGEAIAGAAK